jgi:hypothetical protein
MRGFSNLQDTRTCGSWDERFFVVIVVDDEALDRGSCNENSRVTNRKYWSMARFVSEVVPGSFSVGIISSYLGISESLIGFTPLLASTLIPAS